jgi:hypothetical protein
MTERTLTISACPRDAYTNNERFNLDGMRVSVFGADNIQCDYDLVMTIVKNESPYTIIIRPAGIDSETLTLFMHDLLEKYTMYTKIIQSEQGEYNSRTKILVFSLKYIKYYTHK